MRPLPLLLAALLAACAPQTEAPGPSTAETGTAAAAAPEPTPTRQAALAAPTTLAGEWRLAGIDGEDFDEPYGIALSANEGEIWWSPRCAGQAVRYRIEGNRFVVIEPSARATPPVVCDIGLPPRLPEVIAAIRAANRIERTPANGIELSGTVRSVTLFSQ